MNEPVFILRETPTRRSMDYEALRQEGIRFLEQYASDNWTDYNVHDPGITILEYLCYGITDVGYRCDFSIHDFLYSKDLLRSEPVNNAFFGPQRILPSAAVTAIDYRKLIIDRITEVQNAWVIPLKEQKQGFKGLYTVRIQVNEELKNKSTEDIVSDVLDLLSANRNLCEDIDSVVVLDQVMLDVSAKIELKNDASVEQVLADVLHQIEHLVPEIRISSLEALQEEGWSMNEIMDGPEPIYGLIKNSDLKSLPSAIYVSEIRDIINATNGVGSVEDVSIKVDGGAEILGEFSLNNNVYPVLSERMKNGSGSDYPIAFFRNGRRVHPNLSLAAQILKSFATKEFFNYERTLNFANPAPPVNKYLGDIGTYYSIQRFFPAVYGIGAYGLSKDNDVLRLAQAKQMKGYLAVLEIFLADYLKKLTRIKYLFSIEEEKASDDPDKLEQLNVAYVAQRLADIPDIEPLLNYNQDESNHRFHSDTILSKINSSSELHIENRHQFVNHLLARFAESIDESLFCYNLTEQQNPEAMRKAALEAKCRMLREYDLLSRNRGLGFDYRAPVSTSKTLPESWGFSIAGFKKRICSYLNISQAYDRSLTSFFPFEGHKLEKASGGNIQKTDTPKLPFRMLLKYGALETYYAVKKTAESGTWSVAFKLLAEAEEKGEKTTLYPLHENAISKQEALQWRNQFIANMVKFDTDSKGFFIVEHLLLRPRLSNDNIQIKMVIKEGNIDVEFVSIGFGDHEEMGNIAEKILLLGARKENYEVLQDGMYYYPIIKQSNKPVMISTRNYGKTEADALQKELTKYFTQTLKDAPGKVNNWIEQKSIPAKGLDLNEFYGHRLSVILPNWPVDFMEKEDQLAIEYLIAQHVPAHLKVDFHWLSWADLKKFENCYLPWLEAKNNLDIDDKTLNDRSFELLKFLAPNEIGDANSVEYNIQTIYKQWQEAQKHRSTEDKTLIYLSFKLVEAFATNKIGDPEPNADSINWIPGYGFKASEIKALYEQWLESDEQRPVDDKTVIKLLSRLNELLINSKTEGSMLQLGKPESGLPNSKLQSIFKKYPYLMINPEDLQAIEGINAEIEKWLRGNQVFNWTVLSKIDAGKLLGKPRSPNLFSLKVSDINSWKEQAAKIITAYDQNEWETFEQYQMDLPGQTGAGSREPKIKRLAAQKKKSMYLF